MDLRLAGLAEPCIHRIPLSPERIFSIRLVLFTHVAYAVSFISSDSAKGSNSSKENKERQVGDSKSKKRARKDGNEAVVVKDEGDEEIVNGSGDEKRKKKKKKKMQVKDLRFEMGLDKTRSVEKRGERKKKYLEAKKKHKKSEESFDFPGREQIQFGDVVQAPPKLTSPSKLLKNVHDASRERLRLQAIESYRNRKGWTSRPGLHLPPPVPTTLPL